MIKCQKNTENRQQIPLHRILHMPQKMHIVLISAVSTCMQARDKTKEGGESRREGKGREGKGRRKQRREEGEESKH